MVAARSISLMLTGAMLVALAGCVTTHGHLSRSTDRLERNAGAFASDTRYSANSDYRNTDLARDAHELADRTDELRRAVSDRTADDQDVKAAFDQVSRSYHALRDDVEHSGDPEAREDLRPVTRAYLDVEDDIGGYPAHRYAEDEDQDER